MSMKIALVLLSRPKQSSLECVTIPLPVRQNLPCHVMTKAICWSVTLLIPNVAASPKKSMYCHPNLTESASLDRIWSGAAHKSTSLGGYRCVNKRSIPALFSFPGGSSSEYLIPCTPCYPSKHIYKQYPLKSRFNSSIIILSLSIAVAA